MAIHIFSFAVDVLPVMLLATGAILLWRRAHAKASRRPWLGSAIWIAVCVLWFAFPITNLCTSVPLNKCEKNLIKARLNGVSESEVLAVLGSPEWRRSPSGSADVSLSYPTTTWWSYWNDGLYIRLDGDRVTGFYDFE